MDHTRQKHTVEEDQKQRIYNLMNGVYDLEQVNFPESRIVESEFEEGKPCAELYRQVYEAKVRICERLGVEEDYDVESIIGNMEEISHILALKMFDYAINEELVPRG